MKIVAMNDCDWMIGESVDACVSDYAEHYDPEGVDEAYELTAEELEALTFTDDDGWQKSFADQLKLEISNGGDFPRLFASTEQ